jgi:hypothetical protein
MIPTPQRSTFRSYPEPRKTSGAQYPCVSLWSEISVHASIDPSRGGIHTWRAHADRQPVVVVLESGGEPKVGNHKVARIE